MELFEVKQEPTNHCEHFFIYFFEATNKCQFSDRNQCQIPEKKNYIRTLYFLRFEKWHFLWIQVVLIKFISRFFCWEKTLIHLALQTTTKNLFHQKEVLTYFPIISRCWIENVIVSILWTCCFPRKSIFCCFVVFPRFLIEIEGEMLVLMLGKPSFANCAVFLNIV